MVQRLARDQQLMVQPPFPYLGLTREIQVCPGGPLGGRTLHSQRRAAV